MSLEFDLVPADSWGGLHCLSSERVDTRVAGCILGW